MEPNHGDAGELVGWAINRGDDLEMTAQARRAAADLLRPDTDAGGGPDRGAGRGAGVRQGGGAGPGPGNGGGAPGARRGRWGEPGGVGPPSETIGGRAGLTGTLATKAWTALHFPLSIYLFLFCSVSNQPDWLEQM